MLVQYLVKHMDVRGKETRYLLTKQKDGESVYISVNLKQYESLKAIGVPEL